jgi:NTP pyrophosphatase (non-canonical NTP hydrolase)
MSHGISKSTREDIYKMFTGDDNFKRVCFAIAVWREEKGFDTPSRFDETTLINEKLMIVVTELAEACEAVRHQNISNFKEEIADAFIRLMDLVGTMEIDIADEIYKKMIINESRPHKHGKVC